MKTMARQTQEEELEQRFRTEELEKGMMCSTGTKVAVKSLEITRRDTL
jgi:hypothetical protein